VERSDENKQTSFPGLGSTATRIRTGEHEESLKWSKIKHLSPGSATLLLRKTDKETFKHGFKW
jgi:hypothetical protein